MRANAERGTIEILCKATGPGLSALVQKPIGELVNMTGPIGQGFKPHADKPRAVLIGGGYGGSAIALLKKEDVEKVKSLIYKAFKDAGFKEPRFFISTPAQGARVIN